MNGLDYSSKVYLKKGITFTVDDLNQLILSYQKDPLKTTLIRIERCLKALQRAPSIYVEDFFYSLLLLASDKDHLSLVFKIVRHLVNVLPPKQIYQWFVNCVQIPDLDIDLVDQVYQIFRLGRGLGIPSIKNTLKEIDVSPDLELTEAFAGLQNWETAYISLLKIYKYICTRSAFILNYYFDRLDSSYKTYLITGLQERSITEANSKALEATNKLTMRIRDPRKEFDIDSNVSTMQTKMNDVIAKDKSGSSLMYRHSISSIDELNLSRSSKILSSSIDELSSSSKGGESVNKNKAPQFYPAPESSTNVLSSSIDKNSILASSRRASYTFKRPQQRVDTYLLKSGDSEGISYNTSSRGKKSYMFDPNAKY